MRRFLARLLCRFGRHRDLCFGDATGALYYACLHCERIRNCECSDCQELRRKREPVCQSLLQPKTNLYIHGPRYRVPTREPGE